MATPSFRKQEYKNNIFTWRSVRDSIIGTNAVKRANEIYLPIPSGFLIDDTAPSHSRSKAFNSNDNNIRDFMIQNAPYWHWNIAYMGYLQRARFPEIVIHTLRGLIGIATRKKIEVELPSKISYLEENATNKGRTLQELFVFCLSEVLQTGRVTLVVNPNKNNEVDIVPFVTETYINWRNNKSTGQTILSVFEEKIHKQSESDEFAEEESVAHITYSMDKDGKIVVRKFVDDDEIIDETKEINLQGGKFEELPIVSIGSIVNTDAPNPAPLLGIAEIAYSIYRKDADLSQSEYMTCNPNLVITGVDGEETVPNVVGSTVALLITNENAKVFYTETDTTALDHMTGSIAALFEEAANYGAALLGPSKKAAESTETVKIRQGAQGATLIGIVDNVVKGITDALKMAAEISGADPEDVVFNVSTDFAERDLSPQMLKELVNSWIAGAYSKESLLKIMKESNLLNRDEDIEEEILRIANEGPNQ